MKVNRSVEYSLISLNHLRQKEPGVLTSVKEISDGYGCSFDVMSRVLQKMARAGILQSVQGPQGGYQIVKDLKKISYYDLSEILTGPVEIAKCLHQSGDCEIRSTCNIVSPIKTLNEKLILFYKSLPISELLNSGAKKPGGNIKTNEADFEISGNHSASERMSNTI